MVNDQSEIPTPAHMLCGDCGYRRIKSSGTYCLKYYPVRLWHGDYFPDYPRWTECGELLGSRIRKKQRGVGYSDDIFRANDMKISNTDYYTEIYLD